MDNRKTCCERINLLLEREEIEDNVAIISLNLIEGLEDENLPNYIFSNEHGEVEFKYLLPGTALETITITNRKVEHFYALTKSFSWDYKSYFVGIHKNLTKSEMFWLNKTMEHFRLELKEMYGEESC